VNRDEVDAYVFEGVISNTDARNTIYSDPEFGLGNIDGLYYWCAAADNYDRDTGAIDTTTEYYLLIKNHFKDVGLTDEQITGLMGPGTVIFDVTLNVHNAIRTDPNLAQTTGQIDYQQIV